MTLAGEMPSALAGEGFETANGALVAAGDDVAEELPELLGRIEVAGGRIADVHVEAPTLQSVFIHLTGRELRE